MVRFLLLSLWQSGRSEQEMLRADVEPVTLLGMRCWSIGHPQGPTLAARALAKLAPGRTTDS
jgi:hypothetical protein